jgi:hypothetical protein
MLETPAFRCGASVPARRSENEGMRPARACFVSFLVMTLLGAAGQAARAEPSSDDEFRRNGAVSRHLWAPQAARTEMAGTPVSLGLALGLRGPLRDQLGVRMAPAVQFELDRRSSVALLASGRGGAMLVWQRNN